MGTIGHHTLLYEMKRWQIRAAIRGYYRQQRPYYESARMLGLWTVSCQRSKDAPPLKATDLVKFPWESDHHEELSDEQADELMEMIRQENELLAKKAPQQ